MDIPAAVVIVSDRSAAGHRADAVGPVAVETLRAAGFACAAPLVIADGAGSVAAALRKVLAAGTRLVVTSGGTGLGPRDETPEGTASVLTRTIPGIAEELRRQGAAETPGALLSRGLAGVVDAGELSARGAVVVNLPGSPKAVASGLPLVLTLAPHLIEQLDGGDH